MRAWVVDGAFGLDRLTQVDRPDVEPGPGEVRVRVRAVSLNYRDVLMVRGLYDPRQALPLVPCSDASGVIDAVGEGVTGLAVGARVCPIFAVDWLSGDAERSMLRSTLGGPRDGTLRQSMVVPASAVVRVPDHLTDEEAATLPCAGVTAWRALVTMGGLKAGDTVLTQGTGGVSCFVTQIGAMFGARVIVTSSSDAKLERVRALGAAHGINYKTEPQWGKAAAAWTGGRGVDHVIELGGAGTLDETLRAVRVGGTVTLLGILAGAKVELNLTRVFMNAVRVQGLMVGHRADFEALLRALEANRGVRPVVDKVFDFDDAPAAFAHLVAAGHVGKVVLRLP